MRNFYCPELLPERLKEARKYRNYKQDKIADLFGFKYTAYSRWENGTNKPNAFQLARVANLEKIDLNFYFTPDMTPEEADLDKRNDLTKRIYSMEEEIRNRNEAARKAKSLAERIEANAPLREIFDLVKFSSARVLKKVKVAVIAVLALEEDERLHSISGQMSEEVG